MIEELVYVLNNFYNKLKNNILRDRKLMNDSVLWTLIQVQAKKREEYLNTSFYSSDKFSSGVLKELLNLEFIDSSQANNGELVFTMTAHGIWEIEKNNNSFSEIDLINFIQEKYFKFSASQKPFEDKEKIAVLALLCIRNFSYKVSMDLNTEKNRERWEKIFNKVFYFLNNEGFLKDKYNSFENFINKNGSEHPVQTLMRHLNDLHIKSGRIYDSSKNNSTYILNIFEGNKLHIDRLKYIFKLVFPNISNYQTALDIANFCIEIANNNAKYVITDFQFIDYKHDEIIKEIITEIYME